MAFAVPQARTRYKNRSGKSSYKTPARYPIAVVEQKPARTYSRTGGRYFNKRGKISTPMKLTPVKLPQGELKYPPEANIKLVPKNKPVMIEKEIKIESSPIRLNTNNIMNKFERIPAAMGKGTHYHQVEVDSKKTVKHPGGMPDRTTYTTVVNTGKRMSKAMKLLATLQGVTKRVTGNTKQSGTDAVTRANLDHRNGFNQVYNWLLPAATYLSNIDITFDTRLKTNFPITNEGLGISSPTGLVSGATFTRLVQYMCIYKHKTEIEFYNQNKHFPIEFKLSLVKVNHTNVSNIYTEVGNKALNVNNDILKTDAVPVIYTQDYPGSATWNNNSGITWNSNKKANGLSKSNFWNTNFEVVKTYRKKVEAGSTWHFKHTHEMGSGININDVVSRARNGEDPFFPLTYMYLLEAHGPKTEGILRPTTNPADAQSYIGYAPVNFLTEFVTTMEFINNDTSVTTGEPGAGGVNGNIIKLPHIRSYVQDEGGNSSLTSTSGATRELFSSTGNLTSVVTPIVPNTWVIPLTTDDNVIYTT